ncbi:flagellar hook capping FlgD N-terminal domain-containing protein [Anaerocolumna sp. MB42-C2]|uniref:flagellar hook capping FlgD N-terminal domain-containing protein n=1 Tax=Anaerocolumna sp. MB42-C2 TaxID=3070997 RepID=UPI0027E13F8C|nr:flagellar hook capping FlgD N-terminal domain-containing protein [Anaerocolumna sp. MB42-C2]WMJ88445.1 flagellar hook capping FlgD N-terminal domain-containing protein [Anaerocolumna sp. MB42-C2]
MSETTQSIINSLRNQANAGRESSSKTGDSSLGKDAFLQLLVTQMKYQDPLNPSSDTQFVEQLATFSQLEQMQNLNQTYSNSQAFGLVGKNVIVKTADSSGKSIETSGTVDCVVITNGTAKLAINGDLKNLYTLDQLEQVIDNTYLIKQGLPYIPKKVEATFDKSDPKDISFEVNLGKGETVATDVAIVIGGKAVDEKLVSVKGTTVTIKKEAFKDLENGVYKPALVFNDALYTTITDEIAITVKGEAPAEVPDTGDDKDTGEDPDTKEEPDTGDGTV